MQAAFNLSRHDSDRNRSQKHHIRLFKTCCGQPSNLRSLLLILLLLATVSGTSIAQTTQVTKPSAPSDAQKAFEKMKTLAGSWQGTILNIPINVTIRVASSGNAILHEANTDAEGPPKHEITMFYVEGDRLLATHYCDGGNRARFEGKILPDEKTIDFTFLDVAGGTSGGLVKHMAFNLIDANKHVIDFVFIMPDGKSIDLRGEFQRTK